MVERAFKVIWDPLAAKNLKSIFLYLQRKESLAIAEKVRREIVAKVKSLQNLPSRYSRLNFLSTSEREVRSFSVWSYRIVYEVFGEEVWILAVFHSSRDPEKLEKQLSSRKKEN